ncbi:allophanate hydrolase [halophilic archaeon]|nr:allophanate hydrolase [halophilic archaeon]
MIEVQDGGLSTTVQDLGRYGHYHIGMPPSGAMDQFAGRVANMLVGNGEDAAVLEMTYQGPTLEFSEETVIAIAGAHMSATLDGEDLSLWTAHTVNAGSELSFDFATEGARTYLAVAGGIDVPTYMDSRSTYTLVSLGGYEGRALEAGDTLPIGETEIDPTTVDGQSVPDDQQPTYDPSEPIRVVIGLCDYRLTDDGRRALLDSEWTVSSEADRVGYRLEGPDIEFEPREQPFGAGTDPSNVVDLGYPVGSIQVPEQPIILMRDAVTGGGYVTVGTVISVDRNRLAQRPTNQSVYFEEVSVEEAHEARHAHEERLDAIRSSL